MYECVSVTETYCQEADACSGSDDHNFLTVSVEDGGAGHYLVLSSERWALDLEDIPGLVKKLTDIYKRVGEVDQVEAEPEPEKAPAQPKEVAIRVTTEWIDQFGKIVR